MDWMIDVFAWIGVGFCFWQVIQLPEIIMKKLKRKTEPLKVQKR